MVVLYHFSTQTYCTVKALHKKGLNIQVLPKFALFGLNRHNVQHLLKSKRAKNDNKQPPGFLIHTTTLTSSSPKGFGRVSKMWGFIRAKRGQTVRREGAGGPYARADSEGGFFASGQQLSGLLPSLLSRLPRNKALEQQLSNTCPRTWIHHLVSRSWFQSGNKCWSEIITTRLKLDNLKWASKHTGCGFCYNTFIQSGKLLK